MDCLNMFKLSMVFNESCVFPSLAFSEYYIALSYSTVMYSDPTTPMLDSSIAILVILAV